MAQPDIDGALVGGASLDPDEFARIVQVRGDAGSDRRRGHVPERALRNFRATETSIATVWVRIAASVRRCPS